MGRVELLRRYRHFVLDCDGVLWHSAEAIAGAVEAVRRLRESGADVVFMTNNSTRTREAYLSKFTELGFDGVRVEDINTSGSAVAEHCQAKGFDKVFAIGETGLVDECRQLGIEVVQDGGSGDAMDDTEFARTETDAGVKAVVMGWDRTFNYRKLSLASLYLQGGAQLVATNPDASDKVGGRFMPGNGCAVAAVQYSVNDPYGERTTVVGKPNGKLIDSLLDKYGFKREATLMVGDRLDTDIKFAVNGKIDSLLVLSGCSTKDEADQAADEVAPTFVADDLRAALDEPLEPFQQG